MRRPFRAESSECLRRWHLAQAIGETKTVAHTEVVYGQHILAAELIHQHHLDGPAPDATHLRETLDDREVLEGEQFLATRHDAFNSFRGQVFQRRGFGVRETGCAEHSVGSSKHLLRRWESAAAYSVDEALEDVVRSGGVQLLVCDRARECLKRRAFEISLQLVRPDSLDDPAHHEICRRQMRKGALTHFWQVGQ